MGLKFKQGLIRQVLADPEKISVDKLVDLHRVDRDNKLRKHVKEPTDYKAPSD